MTEWGTIYLSIRVALVATLAILPLGILTAYGLARNKLRPVFLFENLIQLPLVLPPVVTGFFLLFLLSPDGFLGRPLALLGLTVPFTQTAASLAAAIVAFPLMVQPVRVAFEQIDPEWEEAGYVYGGTRWTVFRMVTLPLAGRGVAAGIILAFARALGEFGATIVLAGNIPGVSRTIPLAIFTELNRLEGQGMAIRLALVAVGISVASLAAYALLTRKLYKHDKPESGSW
ncbi:MAG: molybdate ABC transporter permease subunit [Rhodothermales bacterium]|nr:molybdate ABC transporter permease subunit [Rhodothermales bacterium]